MSDETWSPEDMPSLATAIVHAHAEPHQPLEAALKSEAFKTAIMCSVDAIVHMAEHFAAAAPKGRATDAMLLLIAQYFVERGYTNAQAAQELQRLFTDAWSAVMDNRLRGQGFDLAKLKMEKFDA